MSTTYRATIEARVIMPFGLDLWSVIVGILLGMFVIPMLTSVIFGLIGGGAPAATQGV